MVLSRSRRDPCAIDRVWAGAVVRALHGLGHTGRGQLALAELLGLRTGPRGRADGPLTHAGLFLVQPSGPRNRRLDSGSVKDTFGRSEESFGHFSKFGCSEAAYHTFGETSIF